MTTKADQQPFDAEMLSRALLDAGPELPAEVNDEDLILLAEGRLADVPSERRAVLLQQVASRPELAELVKELSPLVYHEPAAPLHIAGTQAPGADSGFRFARIMQRHSWKVAALITLGFGIWSFTAPATNTSVNQPPTRNVLLHTTQAGTPIWRLVVAGALVLATSILVIPALRSEE